MTAPEPRDVVRWSDVAWAVGEPPSAGWSIRRKSLNVLARCGHLPPTRGMPSVRCPIRAKPAGLLLPRFRPARHDYAQRSI